LEITEIRGKGIDDFIEFPFRLYSKDPLFSPLLRRELRRDFSEKNPFFRHARVRFFIARKEGMVIGRVVSIINRRHIEFHHEKAGFFGFFESIEDYDVARLLLDTVKKELSENGLTIMRGPMNFSTNEECGFLVDGYEYPPMLMTPYNPPYYNDFMERYGMRKAKDLYAFIHDVRERLPEKILRVAAIAEKRGITVRPVRKDRFDEEMLIFKEIYNSAWEKNWGFIPLTDEELNYLGSKLREIIVPELTLIAEDDGLPVGFMGLFPDFNQVLRKMKGQMNPLSILKALYYSKRISDLRLLLLGIKKEYRNKGVDALLFREGFVAVRKGGYKRVEFSWILEDNIPVQRLVEMIGARLYKRYRIYEKEISSPS
jgi:GNAT superfamily N-acetyltransferase